MTATILIADDDNATCTVLSHAVKRRGWESLTTHHGETLLEWVKQGKGDVVITDAKIQALQGAAPHIHLLPAIHKMRPGLPIIIIGNPEASATDSGVSYECLPKPFNLNALLEQVDKALANSGPATLEKNVREHLAHYFKAHAEGQLPPPGLHERILSLVEKPLIETTLKATGGNQLKAAYVLGINRNTLRKKIHDLKIDINGLMP